MNCQSYPSSKFSFRKVKEISGDFFNLSEREFGAWVALAIHDTASVIGAASMMGDEAIEVAATLKVTRTLWIVPLVIGSAWLFRNKSSRRLIPK